MTTSIVAAFLLWGLFNWLAPLSLLSSAQRISSGRVPGEILQRAQAQKVRFYVANLTGGFALSTWMGPFHAVILDRAFMRFAHPDQVRFVLAHELGHCALGHLRWRWAAVTSGAILLPWVRQWLNGIEDDAHKYAEELSCIPRSVIYGAPK